MVVRRGPWDLRHHIRTLESPRQNLRAQFSGDSKYRIHAFKAIKAWPLLAVVLFFFMVGIIGPKIPTGTNHRMLAQQAVIGSGSNYSSPELRRLLPALATNQTIIMAIANYDHRDFVINWVYHVRQAGLTNFLIGSLDQKLLEFLQAHGVNSYLTPITVDTEELDFRSEGFNRLGRCKAQIAVEVTGLGYDLLFSDADAVFMRDPFPFLDRYHEADILVQSGSSDYPSITRDIWGLQNWRWKDTWREQYNIGFVLFRASTHRFAKFWYDTLLSKDIETTWDQGVFNRLLKQNVTRYTGPPRNLFYAWDGSVKMGILPVSMFCTGYNYFIKPVPNPEQVYVAHATKVRPDEKRHRLREAHLWKDEQSYFEHKEGFISLEVDVPDQLRDAARIIVGDGREAQLNLVNHQLKQVEHLFAWATVSRRAAVIPKFWSSVDCTRHESEVPPGSEAQLFQAPADQVLEIDQMAAILDVGTFGPNLDYREATFLDKPEAQMLVADLVTVELCESAEDPSCSDGSQDLEFVGGRARLKPDLSYERIGMLLDSVSAKVVRVVGLQRSTSDFQDKATKTRFQRRMSQYAGMCCCKPRETDIPFVQYSLGPLRGSGGAFDSILSFLKRFLPSNGKSQQTLDDDD